MFIVKSKTRRVIAVLLVGGLMSTILTSCKNSSSLGAATSWLPTNTSAYLTFQEFDKAQQTRAVELFNSLQPEKDRVKTFEELKATNFLEQVGDFQKTPERNEVTTWLGDEVTLASVPNPNYEEPKKDSPGSLFDKGTGDSKIVKGSVSTGKTVDLFVYSVKNEKLAEEFIKKNLDANGIGRVDRTGSVHRLFENQYVVLDGFMKCDARYDYSDIETKQKLCDYSESKSKIEKVFDSLLSAKKGKSLGEDKAFKDTIKLTDSKKLGRGFIDLQESTSDDNDPVTKCIFESVGAKYPSKMPVAVDFTASKLSFDVALAGATKIAQGPSDQLANAPKGTSGALSIQNLPEIIQRGIDCARDSDDEGVSGSADQINTVASSYLKYLDGEATLVSAEEGDESVSGFSIGVSGTSGAKEAMSQLIDQFGLEDFGLIKEVDDGEYAFYSEDSRAQFLCLEDETQSDCPPVYKTKPTVLIGVANKKLVLAQSQSLYDHLKDGASADSWSSDSSIGEALTEAKEPSMLFGAANLEALRKLAGSSDPDADEPGPPTKAAFDFVVIRIYAKDGAGHFAVTGHIKNT